jgi:hypothetical protein
MYMFDESDYAFTFAKGQSTYDMPKCQWRDKRNHTTLWFITNEVKRNTRVSLTYFNWQNGGEVPQSFEYLEELPAVGHKQS